MLSFRESLILCFACRGSPSLSTAVFGTVARRTLSCPALEPYFGVTRLIPIEPGMRGELVNFGSLDGGRYEFGNTT